MPIVELFNKYLQGIISPAELTELLRYIDQSEEGDEFTQLIQRELGKAEVDQASLQALVDRVEAKVFANTTPTNQPRLPNRPKWFPVGGLWSGVAAAAMAIIAIGLGWFFTKYPDKQVDVKSSATIETDIAPGTNRATLTLADGRTVDLSADQSGIIVGSGIVYTDGSEVIDNGKLTIDSGSQGGNYPLSIVHYQLSTPKGGTYQIVLPDGTKVWLNSASTLKYPSRFDEKERVVELEGEAYFEVRGTKYEVRSKEPRTSNLVLRTSGSAWPFRVVSNGQTVEVLGTKFNITAYSDEEEVNTTLVEGRVRVSTLNGETEAATLAPGQQLTNRNGTIQITAVDVNDYIAWKQGQFVFYGTSMPVLIKQMERWYDVSFDVTVPVHDIELWGSLSRNVMLSEILNVIELNTPLKFTQEGRHVMVHY